MGLNPRRAIDPSLREGVEDVIREVMEGINMLSKERGRIIDFKELLYGYYRVNPKFGVDYILDLLGRWSYARARARVELIWRPNGFISSYHWPEGCPFSSVSWTISDGFASKQMTMFAW